MLVLASASPRRRELLSQAGFSFEVHPTQIPENPIPGENPVAYVTRLAREKAQAVYNEILGAPSFRLFSGERVGSHEPHGAQAPSGALQVLGADTTVTLDNHILGKPESPADAARMLRLLSGRTHRVITGIALVSAHRIESAAEVTTVQFLELSDQEIADYVATREPMDKAGAYAIQGRAARWIPRIEGCYFNVVGLPISLVSTLLKTSQLADSPSL